MVTFREQDNEIVCSFSGQLNTMAVMQDESAVENEVLLAHDRRVTFDLDGVAFVASSFLRLCLKTAKAVGVVRFSVRNLSPEIKKVFVIAGLDKQLAIA